MCIGRAGFDVIMGRYKINAFCNITDQCFYTMWRWEYINSLYISFILRSASNDVKIGPTRADGNRPKVSINAMKW